MLPATQHRTAITEAVLAVTYAPLWFRLTLLIQITRDYSRGRGAAVSSEWAMQVGGVKAATARSATKRAIPSRDRIGRLLRLFPFSAPVLVP